MKQTKREIKIISFSDSGDTCAINMANTLIENGENAEVYSGRNARRLQNWLAKNFVPEKTLVFIGACDTAVHAIAPLLQDKEFDAPVLVSDEKCRHIIPILSGHDDNANTLAQRISGIMGSRSIITVTSGTEKLPEIASFIYDDRFVIADPKREHEFKTAFLREKSARIMIPVEIRSAVNFDGKITDRFEIMTVSKSGVVQGSKKKNNKEEVERSTVCLISPYRIKYKVLHLIPRCFVVGVDYAQGTKNSFVEEAVLTAIRKVRIHKDALCLIVTANDKKTSKVPQVLSEKLGIPYETVAPSKSVPLPAKLEEAASGVAYGRADRLVFGAGAVKILSNRSFDNGVTVSIGMRELLLYT